MPSVPDGFTSFVLIWPQERAAQVKIRAASDGYKTMRSWIEDAIDEKMTRQPHRGPRAESRNVLEPVGAGNGAPRRKRARR